MSIHLKLSRQRLVIDQVEGLGLSIMTAMIVVREPIQ